MIKNMSIHFCPVCNSQCTQPLFNMGRQPLSVVDLKSTKEASQQLPTHKIHLYICSSCTHVFNAMYNPYNIEYSNGCYMYNNGSLWQKHIARLRELVEGLTNVGPTRIIEIGAGDCKFLQSIRTECKKVAIDPCLTEGKEGIDCFPNNFYLQDIPRNTYFILVMRHLLEHMEFPFIFLNGIVEEIKKKNSEAELVIEVPNCEVALQDRRVEDWTYEHPNHFTVKSMCELLQRCGAEDYYVSREYGDEVLVADATVSQQSPDLNYYVENIIEKFSHIDLDSLKKYDNLAFWGGAGKSAMFLRLFNVGDDAIVVDSDPKKWGCYVPGTGILIRSPEILKKEKRTIIATTSWRAKDIRDEIFERWIPCTQLLKFENNEFVEVNLDN